MMKNFLDFLVLIHIYTLLYFLFITIIYYDEKFFGLFSLVLYIHVVIFSILNIYIVILGKKFKTFYLVLYYVYIVFLYSMFPSISLYPIYLYSIIYTYAFLLFFYCRILSDINGSLSFLLPKHNQFFYNI